MMSERIFDELVMSINNCLPFPKENILLSSSLTDELFIDSLTLVMIIVGFTYILVSYKAFVLYYNRVGDGEDDAQPSAAAWTMAFISGRASTNFQMAAGSSVRMAVTRGAGGSSKRRPGANGSL